jgi:hypothetical protein
MTNRDAFVVCLFILIFLIGCWFIHCQDLSDLDLLEHDIKSAKLELCWLRIRLHIANALYRLAGWVASQPD